MDYLIIVLSFTVFALSLLLSPLGRFMLDWWVDITLWWDIGRPYWTLKEYRKMIRETKARKE